MLYPFNNVFTSDVKIYSWLYITHSTVINIFFARWWQRPDAIDEFFFLSGCHDWREILSIYKHIHIAKIHLETLSRDANALSVRYTYIHALWINKCSKAAKISANQQWINCLHWQTYFPAFSLLLLLFFIVAFQLLVAILKVCLCNIIEKKFFFSSFCPFHFVVFVWAISVVQFCLDWNFFIHEEVRINVIGTKKNGTSKKIEMFSKCNVHN